MFRLFCILFACQLFSYSESLIGNSVDMVKKGDFTFVVSITKKLMDLHVCNGALVTKRHVLTSEKCVATRTPTDLQVLVGSNSRENAQRYDVSFWVTYDEWAAQKKMAPTNNNHVAVITMTDPVSDQKIAIAGIFKQPNSYKSNVKAIIAGWSNDATNPVLMGMAYVTVLQRYPCLLRLFKSFKMTITIPDKFFCSFMEPYALLGEGDQGGVIFDEKNFLIGLNYGVFPKSDDPESKVNLHLNLDYFRDFILEVMQTTIRRSEMCDPA